MSEIVRMLEGVFLGNYKLPARRLSSTVRAKVEGDRKAYFAVRPDFEILS